jgi:hypothetical protein
LVPKRKTAEPQKNEGNEEVMMERKARRDGMEYVLRGGER